MLQMKYQHLSFEITHSRNVQPIYFLSAQPGGQVAYINASPTSTTITLYLLNGFIARKLTTDKNWYVLAKSTSYNSTATILLATQEFWTQESNGGSSELTDRQLINFMTQGEAIDFLRNLKEFNTELDLLSFLESLNPEEDELANFIIFNLNEFTEQKQ